MWEERKDQREERQKEWKSLSFGSMHLVAISSEAMGVRGETGLGNRWWRKRATREADVRVANRKGQKKTKSSIERCRLLRDMW